MEIFQKEGVDPTRFIFTGIPVDPYFMKSFSKEEVMDKLGLSLDKDYILLGAGSMGVQGMMDILDQLKSLLKKRPKVHLLAFCGSNEELLKQIQNLNHP